MRPASQDKNCFYCHMPIGSLHKADCVLVSKKVKVRMTVDFDIEVPAFWDKHSIEFQRNESSWCKDNALTELAKFSKEKGCLCPYADFKYLGFDSKPYLKEN
jgi:hypothetical protein